MEEVKKVPIDTRSLEHIKSLPSITLFDRNLKRSHTSLYGVKSLVENNKELQRYYPVTENGTIVGYKIRTLPKSFSAIGDGRGNIELFGQSKFKGGGKILIITSDRDWETG